MAEHNGPVKSGAEKGKAKDDSAESVVLSKQLVVKVEDTSGKLPFVQAIMDVNISEHFVPPQISIYDETTDPDNYIKAFSTRMAF